MKITRLNGYFTPDAIKAARKISNLSHTEVDLRIKKIESTLDKDTVIFISDNNGNTPYVAAKRLGRISQSYTFNMKNLLVPGFIQHLQQSLLL